MAVFDGQVRAYPAFFRFPWSPRGRLLLVPRERSTRIWIERLDARTGRRRVLTDGPGDVWPSWSPDGATIAFTRLDDTWLMAADGTRERRLFPNSGDPVWSPDGRRLAVVRPSAFRRSLGPRSLWIVSRDGRSARKVPGAVLFGQPSSVVWSPAGDRLLVLHEPRAGYFPGRGVGAADAYSIDPVTGRSRLFGRQVIPLGWYRDGVLYLRGRSSEATRSSRSGLLARTGRARGFSG